MSRTRWELAKDLLFPEGPVYLGRGELVFTEIQGQRVSRYANGGVTVLGETGGGANGAALGADGRIYVANNGGLSGGHDGTWHAPDPIPGRIQTVTMYGAVEDFATELPGSPPHRPNDLCFGPDDSLYFTDPHNWEDLANLGPGRLCRADPDGRVELVAEVPYFPNGIGFGVDASKLYVAQSVTQRVLEYSWSSAGVGDPREFCLLPNGFPDGFCFSTEGDLIVCGSLGDAVYVFDSEGELKETIETGQGSEPTNCCLGDGMLYVTLAGSGELIGYELGIEALSLYPGRD